MRWPIVANTDRTATTRSHGNARSRRNPFMRLHTLIVSLKSLPLRRAEPYPPSGGWQRLWQVIIFAYYRLTWKLTHDSGWSDYHS